MKYIFIKLYTMIRIGEKFIFALFFIKCGSWGGGVILTFPMTLKLLYLDERVKNGSNISL